MADWLFHLVRERKLSSSSVNIAVNAVRFLYGSSSANSPASSSSNASAGTCSRASLRFDGMLRPLGELKQFAGLMRQVLASPWVVYAKRPFAGPEQVLAYLSRYTHRVAIGRGRITKFEETANTVTFRYKDYADAHRQKTMTLATTEFLRRFCLHILPGARLDSS